MATELVSAYRATEAAHVVIAIAREIGGGRISEQVQQLFLDKCINDEICRQYPPSRTYMENVMKKFILVAEAESECVLDDLYTAHSVFYLEPESVETDELNRVYKTYTYTIPASDTCGHITLHLSNNILEGGTGCYCWPAGLYLAEVLLSYPWLVESKCCLELGAGAGLVGICLSRLGASTVILTDGDQMTLSNLEHNLCLNNLQNKSTVRTSQLLWESSSKEDLDELAPEIILAADVIYDPVCIPSLVKVLSCFLIKGTEPNNMVAFLATVKRNPETLSLFVNATRDAGLEVLDVTESMKPLNCWRGICMPERNKIVLHKVIAA